MLLLAVREPIVTARALGAAGGGGTPNVFGAVLAGGRSRRFGSDKALAELGGESLLERAVHKLERVAARVGIVANESATRAGSVAVRPDEIPEIGPLGGLYTALGWAVEEGTEGVIVLATDMPFVPVGLLVALAEGLDAGTAVVPASRGPRGLEPLCAAYHVDCLDAVTDAVERGERAVISFFPAVRVRVLEPRLVSTFGDPEEIFFNVNRPADQERARELLGRLGVVDPRPRSGSVSGKEDE